MADCFFDFAGNLLYNIPEHIPGKGELMPFDLPDTSLLRQLESIAGQLEIVVRYENLADDEISVHSGGCRLLEHNLIIIDCRCSADERARILARELAKYPLEDLFILPRVREFIFLQSPAREKYLPQR
jgi:hypothetical protein